MIPDLMILTGSLIILALAGYWMRRAAKADRRVAELEFGEEDARGCAWELFVQLCDADYKLTRIIALETKSMAHVGKVAVAIAKGLK